MHSIQQIIENQSKYKEEIYDWFKKDYSETKSLLFKIETEDKFILSEKEKLEKKFKKFNFLKYLKKFFFMNINRNKEFYIWWDDENKEANILQYDRR